FLAAGRSPELKQKLMKSLSDAVVTTLGADPENVTVQVIEAPLTDKMKGGKTFVERQKK
ncbi:tautomerase family protein, partial [Mycobacterium tuberculosis]|nr:tautomerase family protein [Mycobacterium tuberculosis]